MASSRVAELARAEADEAEQGDDAEQDAGQDATPDAPAEPDDAEQDAESQPEAVPSAPPVDAPAAIGPEEIAKAEKAIAAHRKKLAGIFGPEAVAHDCFACAGMGFTPELPPDGMTFRVVYTEAGAELVAESPVPDTPLREAPDKEACPECDGIGQVLSGSRNPHARVVGCSKCSGNGWIVKAREPEPMTYSPEPVASGMPNGGQASIGTIPDAWGRPAGHKYWGVPPADVPV